MYCHHRRICDVSQVRPPGLGPAATLIHVKGWFLGKKSLGPSQHSLSSGDVISAQETREVSSGSSLTQVLETERVRKELGAHGRFCLIMHPSLPSIMNLLYH